MLETQFIHSPVDGHSGCFWYKAIVKTAAVSVLHMAQCGHLCPFLLHKYLGWVTQHHPPGCRWICALTVLVLSEMTKSHVLPSVGGATGEILHFQSRSDTV